MTGTPVIPIAPEERGMAIITHLSGLAGYIVPFAGVIIPTIIWITRKDEPVISAIARQAVLLNVGVFVAFICGMMLALTLVLIPALIIAAIVIFVAMVALPVYGAIMANRGTYYRYPIVGANP